MKGFVTLLLADLASKQAVCSTNKRIAYLPMDYKVRIEKIMYSEHSWGTIFSKLIDINEYYEDQKLSFKSNVTSLLQYQDRNKHMDQHYRLLVNELHEYRVKNPEKYLAKINSL